MKTNIYSILKQAQDKLQKNSISSYEIDAQILLFYILEISKEDFYIKDNISLNLEQLDRFNQLIELRIKGISVAKIIGKKEFYSLDFITNEHTLDPRPDSEIIIDVMKNIYDKDSKLSMLEIGSGTACLSITIAKYFPNIKILSVDISKEALKIASENIANHKAEKQVALKQSNIYQNVTGTYDIILSNPPYIDSKEIKNLPPEVRSDPLIALDGGEGGVEIYSQIAKYSHNYLKIGGKVILEIGHDQKESVANIFAKYGYNLIKSQKDYSGNDRCIILSK